MKNWNIESIHPNDLRDAIRARLGFKRDDTYGWRNKAGEPCIPHDPTAALENTLEELRKQGATHYGVTASPTGWFALALRAGASYHAKSTSARMAAIRVLIQMTEPEEGET